MDKDLEKEKLKILEVYAEKIAPKDDKETEVYKKIAKILLEPMIPNESPAPEGSSCPNCQKESLVTIRASAWGHFGGRVKCKECDYSDSIYSYLGKNIITVEPLK